MKKIDPTRLAMEYYFLLDAQQKKEFHNTIDLISQFKPGSYIGTTGDPKPKRGRPPGSKNRNKGIDYDAIRIREELELRHNNGAVEEGL